MMATDNFEDDFAVLMGLLPPQDSTGFLDRRGAFKASLDSRAIGRAAGLQRIFPQFEAVLSPEHFALQHIDRRAEHVGRQRTLPVLLIGGGDFRRAGARHQLPAGQP